MSIQFNIATENLKNALGKPDINDVIIKTTSPSSAHEFSFWQVETLLNQAQELLERCQRERTIYDDLRAKWIITGVDFLADELELQIQEERVNKQISQWSYLIQKQEYEAYKKYLNKDDDDISSGWDEIQRVLARAQDIATTDHKYFEQHTAAGDNYKTRRLYSYESGLLVGKKGQKDLALEDALKFEQTVRNLRKVRDEKSTAITGQGGALNYKEKFCALEAQIIEDYNQAIWRMEAAYIGLGKIFGYGNTSFEFAFPKDKKLENLVTWIRTAISWLVRFAHRDHSFSTIISVRNRISEDSWKKALQDLQSKGNCFLEFGWEGAALRRYCYSRVAGISASYISKKCNGVLQVDVHLPRSAISFHAKDGNIKYVEVDQKKLSACRLGRVINASTIRPPEIVGAISQRNASPISNPTASPDDSNWKIQIGVASTRDSNWNDLDDLEIELQINSVPKEYALTK